MNISILILQFLSTTKYIFHAHLLIGVFLSWKNPLKWVNEITWSRSLVQRGKFRPKLTSSFTEQFILSDKSKDVSWVIRIYSFHSARLKKTFYFRVLPLSNYLTLKVDWNKSRYTKPKKYFHLSKMKITHYTTAKLTGHFVMNTEFMNNDDLLRYF